MTPNAALAFADYAAMGPRRSLEALWERYRSVSKPCPTKRLPTLKEWSVRYSWQDRIAASVTALTEARLEASSEIDAASFLRTSELIAERLDWTMPHHLDAVLAIRQAVRKPSPKGTTINVNVLVAELVEKYGLEGDAAAAFDADVRAHLAATRAGIER